MTRLFASLLIAALAAGADASAAASAPAPPRNRICQPCTLPAFGVAMPRHGVLLARGGVFAGGASYLLFDQDRRMLAQGFAPTARPGSSPPVAGVTVTITQDETAALAALADRLWAEPRNLPSTGATDVAWDLWLSDGDVMRRDYGPGNPPGLADELERRMLAILSRHPAAVQAVR